jgi:ABC-type multidrug transport system ATPase subunit
VRVELEQVGKRFGRTVALRDVTVALPSGARTALIGPNGSGKTTLTRVLMGMVAAEGVVRLDGQPAFVARARLARRLAYVPQVAPQMAATVGEVVRAVAEVRGLEEAAIAALAARLDLDLAAVRTRQFRGLSGGMKQKLLLALAFAAPASLLVLDEPTASLDARARARFFELAAERAAGATTILCSHRLDEIRHLVDHVVALDEGRVVYDGPAAAYLAAQTTSVLELRLGADADAGWPGAHGFAPGAAGWWARAVTPAEKMSLLSQAFAALGPGLVDVAVRDVDLARWKENP